LSLEINRDNIFSKRELLQPTGQIDRRRGLYPDNSTYSHGAISNLHQLSFDKFRVDLGWRYHQYKINMFDTTLGSIAVSPRAIVYLMGVSFTPLSSISVFSNISSGYRAPNIDDMGTVGLIDFRYEVPAYDLKPEESLNKELGLRWNKQNISSTATVFHTAFRNLITRIKTDQVINNYPVYIKQNVEQAYIWGAEWTVDGIIHGNWKASANVTYLFGQNLTRKEPMRRIPPLTSNLSFQYSIKNHQVGVQLENANLQNRLAQGDKEDTRIPVGGTPGFSIWHLSVSGKLKAIQYRALLYNMFNRDFRTHGSGINGMGRAFTLSFSFIF
jgi:outer membrane receptor for ferrienterochelin and colicin